MGPPLHVPETPQREQEDDRHQSRFSKNPLVDRDPSFAQTPDGRFCECLTHVRLISSLIPVSKGIWGQRRHGPSVAVSWH
jgi:hypothetical protein